MRARLVLPSLLSISSHFCMYVCIAAGNISGQSPDCGICDPCQTATWRVAPLASFIRHLSFGSSPFCMCCSPQLTVDAGASRDGSTTAPGSKFRCVLLRLSCLLSHLACLQVFIACEPLSTLYMTGLVWYVVHKNLAGQGQPLSLRVDLRPLLSAPSTPARGFGQG